MDVKAIEKKIADTPVPKVKKVALAYSGGLDSSLCIKLLQDKYKVEEIILITVDVGQGEEEIKIGNDKAEALGRKPILIDARKEFTEEWMAKAIQANSDYLGYPVSTSMTRQLIARKVAEMAVENGCDALMEGSTGKGNDQYRMHNVFTLFAPGLKILVPVRDFDLTRPEEEELSKAWGIALTEALSGGDDKTMWCRSIASGAIDLNQEIPKEVWMWYVPPEDAPDKPETVEIEFRRGIPVAVDGKKIPLAELIPHLNVVGGRNGIGKLDLFEDGMIALKSRELYEAPAATIVLKVHRDLEQFCLTKDEIQFKKGVDARWAYMVYHGAWFHPLKDALDGFIERTQDAVNGKITVKLYKGNVDIVHRESDTALFSSELRSLKSKGFDQRDSGPATKIHGLQYELLAKRKLPR